MLMFILTMTINTQLATAVSIHPMLMFICWDYTKRYWVDCFNTSYVNVYRCCCKAFSLKEPVSIHPMLMFIVLNLHLFQALCFRFNTSYVNVYRGKSNYYKPSLCVSIHPMLMFIKWGRERTMIAFRFNTSYVNVYQKQSEYLSIINKFQYILC